MTVLLLALLAGAASTARAESNWLSRSFDAPLASPPADSGGVSASDSGTIVLFTGSGQTWTYDGKFWTRKSPTSSPSPRTGAAMATSLGFGAGIWLFGGSVDGVKSNETWKWTGTNWILSAPGTKPSARSGAAMAYNSNNQKLVLFGGDDGAAKSDTWLWDGTDWQEQAPSEQPSARTSAAMVFDPEREQTVLFGGRSSGGARSSETWRWNCCNWTLDTTSTLTPTARSGAAIAFSAEQKAVVMFGGDSGTSKLADTFAYDGTTWTDLAPTSSPPGRSEARMEYDDRSRQPLLIGGSGADRAMSDIWTLGIGSYGALRIDSVVPEFDLIGEGRAALSITMKVSNPGTQGCAIDSFSSFGGTVDPGLLFSDSAGGDRGGDYTVRVLSNPGIVMPGTPVDITFSVDVNGAPPVGPVNISGFVFGSYFNSSFASIPAAATGAAAAGSWTVAPSAGIEVLSVVASPDVVTRGQSVPVAVTLKNTGTHLLTGVSTGLTFGGGTAGYGLFTAGNGPTLTSGATATFTYEVSVLGTAPLGPVTLDATATGTDADNSDVVVASSANVTDTWSVQAAAALSIGKVTAPPNITQGQAFSVTVEVANTGEATADITSTSLTFSGEGVTASQVGNVPSIAGGTTATLQFSCVAGSDASIELHVGRLIVRSNDHSSGVDISLINVALSASFPVQAAPELSIGAFTAPVTVTQGQTFSASVVVSNTGGATADITSTALTFSGGGLTATQTNTIASIAGGASVTFGYSVTGDAAPGIYTPTFTISAKDANSGADVGRTRELGASVSVQGLAASLSVGRLEATTAEVGQGQSGIGVTMQVMNTGPVVANVDLSRTGLLFNGSSSGYTVTAVGPATIAADTTQTYSFTVAAGAAAPGPVIVTGHVAATDAASGDDASVTGGSPTTSWTAVLTPVLTYLFNQRILSQGIIVSVKFAGDIAPNPPTLEFTGGSVSSTANDTPPTPMAAGANLKSWSYGGSFLGRDGVDDGVFRISIRVADNLGNPVPVRQPSNNTFTVDTTAPLAPTLGLSKSSALLNAGPLTITADFADDIATEPTLEFIPAAVFSLDSTFRANDRQFVFGVTVLPGKTSADGEPYTVTVPRSSVVDRANNVQTAPDATRSGIVDSTGPAITSLVYSEPRRILKLGAFRVTATFSEEITSMVPSVNVAGGTVGGSAVLGVEMTQGGDRSIWSFSGAVVAGDGAGLRTLSITARDSAGNTAGAPPSNTFTVDPFPPRAALQIRAVAIDFPISANFVVGPTMSVPILLQVQNTGFAAASIDGATLTFNGKSDGYVQRPRPGSMLLQVGDIASVPVDVTVTTTAPLGATLIAGSVTATDAAIPAIPVIASSITPASWSVVNRKIPEVRLLGAVAGKFAVALRAEIPRELFEIGEHRYKWSAVDPRDPTLDLDSSFAPNTIHPYPYPAHACPAATTDGFFDGFNTAEPNTVFEPPKGGRYFVVLRAAKADCLLDPSVAYRYSPFAMKQVDIPGTRMTFSRGPAQLHAGPLAVTANSREPFASDVTPTLSFTPAVNFTPPAVTRLDDRTILYETTVGGTTRAEGDTYTATLSNTPDASTLAVPMVVGVVDTVAPETIASFDNGRGSTSSLLKLGFFEIFIRFGEPVSLTPTISISGGTVGGQMIADRALTRRGFPNESLWSLRGDIVAADPNGSRTMTIHARDAAGNAARQPVESTFTVEGTPPTPLLVIKSIEHGRGFFGFVISRSTFPIVRMAVENTGSGTATNVTRDLVFKAPSGVTPYNVFLQSGPTELAAGSVGTFVFEVRPRLDSELGLTQISGDVKYNDPARAGRLVALPTTTFASWFLNGILPPTIAVTGLVPGGLSLSLAGTDHPLNPRNQSRGYEWIQLEPFGPPTAFTPNMVLSPRQLNLGLTTKFSPTRGGKHVVGLRTVGQTQGSEGESPVTTAMVELPLIAGTLPFPDGTIPCGDLTLISRVTDAPPSAVTHSWSSDDGGVLAGVSTDDVTLSVPAANLRPTRTYRFTVLATESPSGITNTATAEIRTEKAVSVIVGGVRRTQYREPLTLTATARLPACVPVSSTAVTLAWSAQTAAGSAVKLPASIATDKASLTIPGGTLSPDTYVFRVDATQVSDASQTASATYRVELFNSKPVPLISPDAMTFGFENSIELNANGSKDPDAGDTLTYGWRFTDTFGLTVTAQLRNGPTSFTSAPVAFGPSSSAARVTLAPNPDPGLYTLELSASDQFLTAPLRTTVLVTEELRVLASPTTEIAPGTAVELSLSGIGSIADSTRTYTWSLADSKGRSVGSFSRNGTADAAATTLFLGDLPAGAYRARVVVQSLRRDRTSELVLQVGNSATVLSGANLSVESPASPFAVIQFSRAELAPAGPREITLDGSRSLVGAGSGSTGLTYSWNLATPVAGALPLFSTAPSLNYKLTKPGDYVFNLDVAQGQSATSRAQAGPFRVTSAPPVPPANARYQVYAKRPEPEFASVPVNAGYVQLDATSSSDPSEEEALTYSWRIVDVPSLTDSTGLSRTVGFADASDGALSLTSTNAKPFVVFDNRRQTESAFAPLIGIGSYRFELTVKKPVAKLASTAFFDVSVQDPSILQPSALIADIAIPPMVVNDDGTTSGPVKGKLKAVEQSSSSLTYRWTVFPAPVSVENGESSEPIFTFDTPGNYQATLIVNDGTYDGRPVTRAFEVKTTDLPPVLIWSVAAGEKRWRVKVDSSRSYTPGTIRPVTHDTRITIKGIFSDLSCLTPRQFWIHGASGPVDDTRTASDAASSLELSFSDNKCHGWQSPVPAEPVEWFVLYHFKATPGTYKAFAQVSNRGGSRTGLYEGTLGATEVGYSLECKTCFGNNPEHVFGPIGPDPSPLVTVFESPPNPKSTARKLSKMGASSSAKNTPEGQLLVTSSSSSSAATGSGIDPGHAASFFSPTSLRVDAPTVVTLKAHLDPLSAPGSPLNFRWQQLEGRSVLLSRLHESSVLESTTAFVPTTSGRLKFQVDADVLRQDPATLQFVSTGDTLTNFVTVLVDSPQSAVPLASATASVTVIPAEGSSTADRRVLLDATGSLIVRGPSDARLTYSWRQVAGADGELQDLGDGKAAFVAPVSGASNEQYYWLELTVTQTPTGEVSEPVYLAITQSALPQRFVQLFSQGVALASTAAAVRNDGTASVADIRVPAGALQGAGLTVETVSAANVRSTPPVVLRTYTLFFHDSGPAEIMLGKQRVVVLNSRLVGGGAATAELLSESPPAAAAENLAGVAGGAGGGCALASSAGGAASSALLMLLPGIWCWLRSQPPHSKRRR